MKPLTNKILSQAGLKLQKLSGAGLVLMGMFCRWTKGLITKADGVPAEPSSWEELQLFAQNTNGMMLWIIRIMTIGIAVIVTNPALAQQIIGAP